MQLKVTNAKSNLSLSLTSDKSNFAPGEKINLFGDIRNGTLPVRNHEVVISAMDQDKVLNNFTTISNDNGKYNISSLIIPYETLVTIRAKSEDTETSSNTAILTLSIAKEKWGLFLPIVSIIISVAFLLFSLPKYQKVGLLGAIIFTALGYFFLYNLTPLETAGTAAISVALLAPLATYVIDSLTKRRETSALLESSVGEYRKTHLTEEVQSLANIFEEIDLHQSIFKAKHDIPQNKLVKDKYDTSKRAGTMANLPGLRINQYYYYLDYYNKFLDAKLKRLGDLKDEQRYVEFATTFQKLKDAYSELNQILYVNVFYNIGEIQSRFLSFPTVEFPIRTSGPLKDRLIKAKVPSNELQDSRIYKPENARKLMAVIGPEFSQAYSKLEMVIQKLLSFKI
jgi:hypothetical protein